MKYLAYLNILFGDNQTQVYTLKCGKLPVSLEHPSAYHKWHCEKHIIEEATYFGVCKLAIFPRKIIKDKIGFF
jgi:hypothetical protein